MIDAIPMLADQGVTAVEIAINSSAYFDHRNAFEVDQLITRLSETGVRAHSIHSPFGSGWDISSPDDEVHERGVDGLIESIELANVLGAQRVIVHASDKISNGRHRRVERARGVLREVGVVARESGVMLALENLPPDYIGYEPAELEMLLDGTDPEAVAVCFDSGHANLSGQFIEFADALLPRSVIMHLHDNNGGSDEHKFPGEGIIDWRQFSKSCRKSGSQATIVLECKPPENTVWSEAFQRFRIALEN